MMQDIKRDTEKVKNPRKDKQTFQCEECERPISEYQYKKGYGLCPDCFTYN